MSDESNFLRLRDEINEAAELLNQASLRAYQCSGDEPGQDAAPVWGRPGRTPVPGDPLLLALCDTLKRLADEVAATITPELAAEFLATEQLLDDLADRADAASY